MIQRYNQKLPVCSYCLETGHTAWKCPKKAKDNGQYNGLKVSSSFGGKRKPMKRGTKRLKPESAKHKQYRQETTAEWFELNGGGPWECYLQVVPDCERIVTKETVNIEHTLSKARHPGLRWDAKKLKPSCNPCNKFKGSRDWIDGQLV